MAGSSLLALIDDIVTLLDDVAILTKVAAKKTAGVLGDDLAVNANQVHGVTADRELPVVWAVMKGSFINKLIIVPIALLISIFLPWLLTLLLIVGGSFLCYEGAEKVIEVYHKMRNKNKTISEIEKDIVDLISFEKERIKGAIRTDLILSSEIIVITLGTIASASLITKIGVLVGTSIIMTLGVYGFVAIIVKLDDFGFMLLKKNNRFLKTIGEMLILAAPKILKFFAFAGTIAMFIVGGGIISHAIHHYFHWNWLQVYPLGTDTLVGFLVGIFIGLVLF